MSERSNSRLPTRGGQGSERQMLAEPTDSTAKPRTLREKWRALLQTLLHEHVSPGKLLLACTLGGMIGATPLFGLHLPLCIGIALLLRLNRAAVYAAANISIPPTAPFLAVASVAIGSRLMRLPLPVVDVATLRAMPPWKLAGGLFLRWLVGAPVVGGSLGLLFGLALVLLVVIRARAGGPEFTPIREAIEARFATAPPAIRHYVRWKLRLDPVYAAMPPLVNDGDRVLDIGAGLGLGAQAIAAAGKNAHVVGFDHDAAKVAAGSAAARGLPIELSVGDAGTEKLTRCDVVLLIDVLHYLPTADAIALLGRVASALAPAGRIVIRETDPDERGSAFTRFIERIAIGLGWNRGRDARYTSINTIVGALTKLDLDVERRLLAGPLHPGNVLLIARAKC